VIEHNLAHHTERTRETRTASHTADKARLFALRCWMCLFRGDAKALMTIIEMMSSD